MSFKQPSKPGHLGHVAPERGYLGHLGHVAKTSPFQIPAKLARQWCEPSRERARLQDYKFAKTSRFYNVKPIPLAKNSDVSVSVAAR